jgi:hypothetical protein
MAVLWPNDVGRVTEAVDDVPNTPLRDVLRATLSRLLGLPDSATFEPLLPAATHIAVNASNVFDTHASYRVPCDYQCQAAQGRGRSMYGRVDIVHCLTLQPTVANPLIEALRSWALTKEELAKASVNDPGPSSDAGVSKTNWGGFQSYPDLFERHEDATVHQALEPCRQLHVIASHAMDELGPEQYLDDLVRPNVGELHPAYAWVNVNRSRDYNFMHVHETGRWSAVFFVSAGDTDPQSLQQPPGGEMTNGHLIFRGGRKRSRGGEASGFSHTYMAVAPVPGSLWLFPGTIPHAVMDVMGRMLDFETGNGISAVRSHQPPNKPCDRRDSEAQRHGAARISIAINYSEAAAPFPIVGNAQSRDE